MYNIDTYVKHQQNSNYEYLSLKSNLLYDIIINDKNNKVYGFKVISKINITKKNL